MAKRRYRNTFARVGREIITELGKGPLEALARGADKVVSKAKELVPVAPVDGGDLKNSIRAEGNRSGTMYKISANATNDKGIAYGQFVEFDPNFSADGPKPFLYPAMRQEKPGIRDDVIDAMREAVQKGAKQ